MVQEILNKQARVVDLDDTIIGREGYTRFGAAIMGRLHSRCLPDFSVEDIARLNLYHWRVNAPIKSLCERVSFQFHARRTVYPGVREEFAKLVAAGVDIYVATGRPNKNEWVDMTDESLERSGVREFIKEVFYTPRNTSTAVSKAHVLCKLSPLYSQVEFDEDDPRTILFLAPRFPDVQFNYIFHRLTSLLVPASEIDKYLNIRRVTS